MILKQILIISFILISFWNLVLSQQHGYIPIEDGVIHYKVFGKGRPILIINGGPGMNSEGFDILAKDFSQRGYLCILFDQRGTGKSEMKTVDSTTITMDKMIADMEVIRQHLKIKKWIVMGQSFGGLLAAQYMHMYPRSIEKLIFSNSGGLNLDFLSYVGQRVENNLSQTERDSMQYYQNILNAKPDDKLALIGRARQLASAYTVNIEHIPSLSNRMLQVNMKINQLVYSDLQRHRFNYVNKFKEVKIPVLIFQGLNDIIALETAEVIKASFADSKLIKLENCGHYPWLDRVDVFWKEIEQFLRK